MTPLDLDQLLHDQHLSMSPVSTDGDLVFEVVIERLQGQRWTRHSGRLVLPGSKLIAVEDPSRLEWITVCSADVTDTDIIFGACQEGSIRVTLPDADPVLEVEDEPFAAKRWIKWRPTIDSETERQPPWRT